MKLKISIGIIMGLIMLALIIVISIVLPIVLLKKKNDPPVELLKQLDTPVELLKQLDTPIVAANQALPETAYTGYIQDAADGQYLIFQIGQPITKTKIKLEATIITVYKQSNNNFMNLFLGEQKIIHRNYLNSKKLSWNYTTQTLSTVSQTGEVGRLVLSPDLTNASLIDVGAVETNNIVGVLLANMTFQYQKVLDFIFVNCPTCIKTLQVVV